MVKIKQEDETGVTDKIMKDGEVVSQPLDREKIGEQTAQMLRDASTVEDIKEYLARVHNVDLEG